LNYEAGSEIQHAQQPVQFFTELLCNPSIAVLMLMQKNANVSAGKR